MASHVKSLLGEVAGTIWAVEDLVVEDGEVECETKADGMRWQEFSDCNGARKAASKTACVFCNHTQMS